ncbi:hypothetical protein [Massilia eurypsychrophila]|jgi:hypothetical protein|uniref:hypothetical protein n=1 Tax=Massilia eurypsychrophila TaxID=1485217 RepID=UPI0015D4DC50|nr:hypothetical protein [Massilia eurypsychrophila]
MEHQAAAPLAQLTPEWRNWIAENVVLGIPAKQRRSGELSPIRGAPAILRLR